MTIADWFAGAQITGRMLRTLDRIGPGGVIIADLYERDYYVTHARTLDPAQQTSFIVFGYHDLVVNLAHYTAEYADRGWQKLVDAVDESTWDTMTERLEDLAGTGFVVTRMREHMQRYGFDLTAVPHYYHRYADPGIYQRPTTRMVVDRYVDRANPTVTVTVKMPLQEATGGLSLIKVTDQGRHVTGWPKALRNQFTASSHAHRVRAEVDAHLRRTHT
ncbi:hypothetical protein KIK06_24750 [Nocardiopsis sp. EMB25]|uniref:hypothetical protein n=1 Tax=Nocardiopsis sp. EMB25 TaxID=2835867 RepID=UPI0022842825|nr:hypothetical protein [Nocardiopsis sp. EMB25]MCY9787098.1 hypothetical protein [Nocardiopsis sp. EMB25]